MIVKGALLYTMADEIKAQDKRISNLSKWNLSKRGARDITREYIGNA